MNYDDYKKSESLSIQECIENMKCQPILFVGTGISRRYFNAPNWVGLMEDIAKACPRIEKGLPYYRQKYSDLIKVASVFADIYREWAWSNGKESFPEKLFTDDITPESYLKYKVAELIDAITPNSPTHKSIQSNMREEIKLLQLTLPHAIITTNYDRFLDYCFPEYIPIIGQQLLRTDHASIGEVFKIHGCTSVPNSLILTSADYKYFMERLKYLNAILFTYFVEHPIFFLGYSATDPNIRAILSDINEMLSPNGELVSNIFFVTWDSDAETKRNLPTEEMIPLGDGKHIRVRRIVSSEYSWIYKAIAHNSSIKKVNVKLLRGLLSRIKQLVRSDIPSGKCTVNYSTIEGILDHENTFETIFGISRIDSAVDVNIKYPYTISMLREKLNLPGEGWHEAKKLFNRIFEDKGIKIEASDNQYHIHMKLGKFDARSKYSEEAYLLLKKVAAGLSYEVDLVIHANEQTSLDK